MDDKHLNILEEAEAFVDTVDDVKLLTRWHGDICSALISRLLLYPYDEEGRRMHNVKSRVFERLCALRREQP